LKKAWVICRKEMREIFRSKYIFSSLLMPIVVFGLFIPILLTLLPIFVFPGQGEINIPPFVTQMIPDYCKTDRQRLIYFVAYFLMGPMLLMVPIMTPIFIAADSFSGEKERKTIEPLLATPTSDIELFFGKVLTAFVPSMIVCFTTFSIATFLLNLSAFQVFGRIIFPNLTYLVMMTATTPLATILSIGVMVLVSARVASVRDASQVGGVLILPVILLLVGQMFALFFINVYMVLAATGLLALVDVILIHAGSSRFGREKILMKI